MYCMQCMGHYYMCLILISCLTDITEAQTLSSFSVYDSNMSRPYPAESNLYREECVNDAGVVFYPSGQVSAGYTNIILCTRVARYLTIVQEQAGRLNRLALGEVRIVLDEISEYLFSLQASI